MYVCACICHPPWLVWVAYNTAATCGLQRGGYISGFGGSCSTSLKASSKASSAAVLRALHGQARVLVRVHMERAMRDACAEALEAMTKDGR